MNLENSQPSVDDDMMCAAWLNVLWHAPVGIDRRLVQFALGVDRLVGLWNG